MVGGWWGDYFPNLSFLPKYALVHFTDLKGNDN
jgi:hypothetical protein